MSETISKAGLEFNVDRMHPIHRRWWGVAAKLLGAIAIGGVLMAIWYWGIEPYEARMEEALAELGPWAPVIFIGFFILTTPWFFPESVLAVAAGAIFGIWWGLLWVAVAGTATAVGMYWLGHTVLRDSVERRLSKHPKIRAIDQAASEKGLELVFLLRLAPINYTVLNWLLGVSRVRFKTFLLSCIGMFPGNLATVYVGYAARHTADLATRVKTHQGLAPGDSIVHEITIYGGLVVSLLVSIIVARIALKAIRQGGEPALSE